MTPTCTWMRVYSQYHDKVSKEEELVEASTDRPISYNHEDGVGDDCCEPKLNIRSRERSRRQAEAKKSVSVSSIVATEISHL